MPEEIAGSLQFHALVAVAPTGQKGVLLENRQVSESKARAIREDAGQDTRRPPLLMTARIERTEKWFPKEPGTIRIAVTTSIHIHSALW